MAELKKPIIIKDWPEGIGESAFTGFEEIRGLNVTDKKGVAFANFTLAKDSSTTVTDEPIFIIGAYQVGSGLWACDNSNDFYNDSGGWSKDKNLTGTAGTGIVEWKGYLFAIRPTNLSYSTDGSAWTDAWETLTAPKAGINSIPGQHMAIVGQDDKVYIANDNYVASIAETAGDDFDPTDSDSYTFNASALTLPENMVISCIAELGAYLVMGTYSRANPNKAYTYLWDRSSTSFEQPIIIEERGVNALITTQNKLYIQAGAIGNWYISEGTTATLFAELPDTLISNKIGGIYVRPGATMIGSDGNIKFGLSQIGSGQNQSPMGVYSLNPNTGAVTMENLISTGNDGSGENLSVTALYNSGNYVYYYGWQDDSTFGIDKINVDRRITSYGAYAITQWFNLGTLQNPMILKGFEIHLSKVLAASEGVKLWYRKDQTGAWTQWGSTITGTAQEYQQWENIETSGGIQFKVELTTPSGSLSTPDLSQIIIK